MLVTTASKQALAVWPLLQWGPWFRAGDFLYNFWQGHPNSNLRDGYIRDAFVVVASEGGLILQAGRPWLCPEGLQEVLL